ncbi:MAG: ABC transporter ATP-binding protein, partial [Bacillota bacterium]
STLILPTSGTAAVNGYDTLTQSSRVRASIGFSPGGERSFYFRLTGRQNLEFFGALQGLRPPRLHRRISEVLNQVGLEEEADKRFMKYSSGMRRKLGIARALLTDPPVLLLDEPTSSVDPASARHIREHIRELKARGRTILLTTHNMDEAERISDRIGILNRGRLTAVDTPANLRGVLHQYRLRLAVRNWGKDPARFIGALRPIAGVSAVSEGNPSLEVIMTQKEFVTNEVLRLIVEHGVEVESITTSEPSLEDIFLTLTGGEMSRV